MKALNTSLITPSIVTLETGGRTDNIGDIQKKDREWQRRESMEQSRAGQPEVPETLKDTLGLHWSSNYPWPKSGHITVQLYIYYLVHLLHLLIYTMKNAHTRKDTSDLPMELSALKNKTRSNDLSTFWCCTLTAIFSIPAWINFQSLCLLLNLRWPCTKCINVSINTQLKRGRGGHSGYSN
jgi:hypothetical protein